MPALNVSTRPGLYERFLLSPFGLDRENALALWLLLVFSSISFGGLWYFEGEMPVVLALLYLAALFLLTMLRIDLSLSLLLFNVLLFDQYHIPGFEPFTREVGFFNNLKEIDWLPYFDAGMVNPVEIHLVLLISSLFILAGIRKDHPFKPVPVPGAFLLFAGALTLSFAYGIMGGGDFMVALWEVRALYYLCVMYLLVPQILSTKRQLNLLVWIFIAGITIKALQGVGRFVQLGFTTGGLEVLTNHEDPVFTVTLFILLAGLLVYRVDNRQRRWLLILLPLLLLGFYVSQRRAAYASLFVSIGAFILLLPPDRRGSFLKYFLPAALLLVIYGGLFWNHSGTLGRPVQLIKSAIEEQDPEQNYDDYYSNLYRDLENYNLAQTVVNNTVKGIGFGKRYEQPIPLVEIPFPLRDYIPHNEILWVLVKMGATGFFAFWLFFNAFAARGVAVFHSVSDPWLKTLTLMIIISVINQMVVSWFDLQLTYYRNMLYLGTLMGLLPVVEYAAQQPDERDEIRIEPMNEDENAPEFEVEVVA